MSVGTPEDLAHRARIVRETRSVAVVGASANESRASYFVSTYLLASTSYEVYFVNPTAKTDILGKPVYPSLAALPVLPDLVDVFRRQSELDEVLTEAIKVGAKTCWLQLGLTDAAVEQRARDAGLQVVADRCLKIEHARFIGGGLHLAGFDTGVIDSRRHPR
ncbi:CoA-binding protein [Sporichthya sp.]|uniref:CoA-binding protein n=1 Tax=Sporichthya sp. TaxID=65475 RepID=UPI0017D4B3E3|nr:CoA-binding protein [Sporichthya sp.]MBA3742044.1 CoA-binding protein [Sporichthya sp.]